MAPERRSEKGQGTRASSNPPGPEPRRDLEHFRELLQAYMAKKGLRSTDQRRVIVETFFRAENHVSIEELLAQVRAQDPRVGYATVYRTLKLLTECGVAYERRFGDGLTRYELADEESHHDHLICVDCGAIIEFEEPRIESIQEEVAKKYGFNLKSHKHEMYGSCKEGRKTCARARDMAERGPASHGLIPIGVPGSRR